MTASPLWFAVAGVVGVISVGAAAWQDRAGSSSRSGSGSRSGLSLEAIRAAIRPLGMKVRRVDGEYRVVFDDYDRNPRGRRDEELAAYYTTDAVDALETARDMAQRRAEVTRARAAQVARVRTTRSR